MRYFAIGDDDTVLGLGLAGVHGQVATGGEEAADVLRRVIGDGDTGIVIITETLADSIRSLVDRYTFTEEFPLILEIPDRHGRDEARPTLREVVNSAIGIGVKS